MKNVMLNKMVVLLLLLTFVSFSGAVFAGEEYHAAKENTGEHMEKVFSYKDKNKDGIISKEEWPGPEDYFKKLDVDNDGKLSLDEFKAKEKGSDKECPKGGENLLFKDVDGNGIITKEEWKGTPEEFQSFDGDQNGSLSKEECQAALELGKEFHHGCISKFCKTTTELMDTDKNGEISLEEWKCSPKEFARLDKDKNGSLSKDEAALCCKAMKDFQSFHKNECPKALFDSKDADKNGAISLEEFKGAKEDFDKLDADKNGSLSMEEITSCHKESKGFEWEKPLGCGKPNEAGAPQGCCKINVSGDQKATDTEKK